MSGMHAALSLLVHGARPAVHQTFTELNLLNLLVPGRDKVEKNFVG